jgi:hypothetical protein
MRTSTFGALLAAACGASAVSVCLIFSISVQILGLLYLSVIRI